MDDTSDPILKQKFCQNSVKIENVHFFADKYKSKPSSCHCV